MKHFAVIGHPIAHSRSPEIHAAFGKQTGIALEYCKILCDLDAFESTVFAFFKEGGSGLNVTVPFKEQAYALCDSLTPRAQTAKAVNTLWQKDGKLHGDNTDGQGLVQALNHLFNGQFSLANSHILILGAGGATRGVILPLLQAGAAHISIANRTQEKAAHLCQAFKAYLLNHAMPLAKLDALGLDNLSGHYDVVINATSASLHGDGILLPQDLSFEYAYEMAYGKPSTFLTQAKSMGAATADGLGMLIFQAAEAFYDWHGIYPNNEVLQMLFQQLSTPS